MALLDIPRKYRIYHYRLKGKCHADLKQEKQHLSILLQLKITTGEYTFRPLISFISTIKGRFEQKGFQMLRKLEILLTTVDSQLQSEHLKEVVEFYHSDFGSQGLIQTQSTLLHANSTKESPLESLHIC